jgi:hypothetical protein
MEFRYRMAGVIAGGLMLAASAAIAQTAERLSDKQVKELIDEVDKGRDKFEGNLDGDFKSKTLRGPNGETKVSGALQDYQDNTKKLQGRFNSDYSAGAEVSTVLKQSMQIESFMRGPSSPEKGRNEWDRQTANLKRLAEAYGTTFPLPAGATIRRMNDKESADAAKAVAEQAEQVKRAVDDDNTLAKPAKETLKDEVDGIIEQAKTLESRLKDGMPATADGRALKEKVVALTSAGRQFSPTVLSAIGGLRAPLEKLDQAFGVARPGTR